MEKPVIGPEQIAPLEESERGEMLSFLVGVFGETFRPLAQKHLQASFTPGDSSSLCFLACRIAGKIVGACAVSVPAFTTGTWGIGWVAVADSWRRKGMGQTLVRAAMRSVARRISARATLLLSVTPSIAPFYETLGFRGQTLDHEGNPFLSRSIDPMRSIGKPKIRVEGLEDA